MSALQDHVVGILGAYLQETKNRWAKYAEMEAAGLWRIVEVTSPAEWEEDPEEGQISGAWEIKDEKTGEVLASGTGTVRDFNAAWHRLDAEHGQLLTVLDIREGGPEEIRTLPGIDRLAPDATDQIPPSLAYLLIEWVVEAPADEVAAAAGWTVEQVKEYLGEGPPWRCAAR